FGGPSHAHGVGACFIALPSGERETTERSARRGGNLAVLLGGRVGQESKGGALEARNVRGVSEGRFRVHRPRRRRQAADRDEAGAGAHIGKKYPLICQFFPLT